MTTAVLRRLERAEVLARALVDPLVPPDPVAFARRAGFEPDDWQRDLLLSNARQMILLCSRQAGKSTISALLGAYEALYRPPSLVLLVAPAQRQSQELHLKVKGILRSAGLDGEIAEESALRVRLHNGSRIIALPGSERTVRGFSAVSLLVEDESARVDDALYQATRPMLATSGGRQILLSTPFGMRGHFFEVWERGGDDWLRVKVTAEQVARIPRDWLERERATIGDWWYRQEYGCQFVDELTSVFPYDLVQAALDPAVEPLFGSAA